MTDPNCPRNGNCFAQGRYCAVAERFIEEAPECECTACDSCIVKTKDDVEAHIREHIDCSPNCLYWKALNRLVLELEDGDMACGCCRCNDEYNDHIESCAECVHGYFKLYTDCACELVRHRCINYRACNDTQKMLPEWYASLHSGLCINCHMIYGDVTSVNEERECPICYETTSENLALGTCKHVFCAACTAHVLTKRLPCPLCRNYNVPRWVN